MRFEGGWERLKSHKFFSGFQWKQSTRPLLRMQEVMTRISAFQKTNVK